MLHAYTWETHLEDLSKRRPMGPAVSDSEGLEWSPRVYISNMLLSDAGAVGPRTTLREALNSEPLGSGSLKGWMPRPHLKHLNQNS